MPEATGETSVFLTKELSNEEVWSVAETYIEAGGRKVRARAELAARFVEHTKLRLVPDSPPPRHAIIIGWPAEKDEKKARALELAQASVLKIRQ